MFRFAAALVLLVFTSIAQSDTAKVIPRPGDHADSIVMPAGSALKLRKFDSEGTASFDGKVKLSGTYYYGRNSIEDGTEGDQTLYFMPDRTTFARLPHFKERGAPDTIYLSNQHAFIRVAIPKAKLDWQSRHPDKYVSGKADIWVDRFEAGIECDAPFFNARFVAMAHPGMKLATKDLPGTGC